ncbi:type I-E CRISPR-associated protein Cse2/CasB [Corynebacterium lizhenjunii]|uniref:Type I-E CRISPR-associated protein Cse2/CasB n=1 Tax=Corynebacterium lizhenjunii TaxID=2709394 RepID=A0A7T0KDJ6_9CORY|nr:type I-E CRISPR-associated protein Cse2/CasB [Corynebacterium lizhenjunii]QPK78815.1 type I-E CRISPR-associated protein Cse2/CasB [Corynebacterium lizhenjunii]
MTQKQTLSRLYQAVTAAVNALQQDLLSGADAKSSTKATLAELRRLAGKKPTDAPLGFAAALDLLYPKLAEPTVDSQGFATYEEEAAFTALTLFALHAQSARRPVHQDGMTFGRACGLLYHRGRSESLKPRFDAVLLSNNPDTQLYHIRSLVTLLRSADLVLDYGLLAEDLRWLRSPRLRNRVLLRWGRDFALAPYVSADAPGQSTAGTASQPSANSGSANTETIHS